ncbi:N-acetylglucosamine-6-phosphate deacetylase [uncultured Maritalea sp.]|uniref:N-acetylglucosamine-6-phosphate deacetylase n=1 Tax=uncultured Maritalea sp. TaxID=757249 RepID=UPI002614061D|nr:N-acetylglucosamine-6-phosphate deacetylase [uncultured Maritalea sp.]
MVFNSSPTSSKTVASSVATLLRNGRIFDGTEFVEGKAVLVEDGKISAIFDDGIGTQDCQIEDLGGKLLVPGFVDVQVNGGGGVMFNDEQSVDALETIANGHRKFGTTTLLPTFITDSFSQMQAASTAMRQAIGQGLPGVRGVHFEGPYFSMERRGVHAEQFVRSVDEGAFDLFTQTGMGVVLVTLAPEVVPVDFVTRLSSAGIRVCAGHTNATYDQATAGFAAGISGVTHLYNAMPPIMNREPGIIGAAYDNKDIYCGLIVDGHHLHHATARTVIACKGTNRIMLVTDAMATVGSNKSSFNLYGTEIFAKNGRLATKEGKLAGSDLNMMDAVRLTRDELGVDFGEALRMASLYPATYLGLNDQIGKIAAGYDADFALIDEATDKVTRTWIKGAGVNS